MNLYEGIKNNLDERKPADYLDEDMLNEFTDYYYKFQEEEPYIWSKEEMEDWINYNKEHNPDTKISMVHLKNLLDFQKDLYKADMEEDEEELDESENTGLSMPQDDEWITGEVTINGKQYYVQGKVYEEPSSYGINDSQISKLWVNEVNKDGSFGKTLIAYDRGWDSAKVNTGKKTLLKPVMDMLIDYRSKNHYLDDWELNESEEDGSANPDYYVDVRDLTLTNGNYHNNADMIYGRIIVKGKTKNAKDVGAYDIMYIPENNHLSVFMPGFDVQELSDIIYSFYEPNDWITFGGNRIQAKAIQEDFDNTFASDMLNINPKTKEAIIGAIDDAYYNEKPIPLNTRKYQ